MKTNQPYAIPFLTDIDGYIEIEKIMPILLKAYSKLEIYKLKIKESRLDNRLFLPALQAKEAYASSAIEGTQATMEDILESRIVTKDKNDDLQSVLNYYDAIRKGYAYIQTNNIDKNIFMELHSCLMKGQVHKETEEVGRFRKSQNCIRNNRTGQTTFMPPVPEIIDKAMENLMWFVNKDVPDYYELIKISIIHAQFETIHPFPDGNGRVGRIFIPLYMTYRNIINNPYFFISEAFERNRVKYYKLLTNIREKNEWTEWILFFLEAVEQQCDKIINSINNINKLYEKDLSIVLKSIKSDRGKGLFDLLFQFPFINSNTVMNYLGIPRNTAIRYLQILESQGILYSDESERDIHYSYHELVNILIGI